MIWSPCPIFVVALLSLCVQVCRADIPRWLSVMPLHENAMDELAADAAALGNDTFVDGIAWMCPVVPEGDPEGTTTYSAYYKFVGTQIILR